MIMKAKQSLALLASSILLPSLAASADTPGPNVSIPSVYPIVYEDGNYHYKNLLNQETYPLEPASERYAPASLIGDPTGSKTGIQFEFADIASSFSVENGRLYMGLIPFGDGIYPQPVLDNAYAPIGTSAKGRNPVADFSLLKFTNDPSNPSNNFDLTRWEEAGNGTVGYRVVNGDGVILYDGKVGFVVEKKEGKISNFVVNKASIITGPFVHFQEDGTYYDGVRVSFDTLHPTTAVVTAYDSEGDKVGDFTSGSTGKAHELTIDGLEPDTEYLYSVTTSTKDGHSYFERRFDSLSEPFLYSFETAPAPGSRLPFAFGFTSDGRTASKGGGMGERFMGGAINGYRLKESAALRTQTGVIFFQLTGDLISGYDTSTPEHVAELLVWKNTIQPFASHTPWLVGMGNHEASLSDSFKGPIDIQVDKFPFETRSAETVFSEQFVNPTNGPESEDGQYYDLNPSSKDFPDYQETAFHYSYDNVAVVSLNSDYWYSPNLDSVKYPFYVGGLHGYVMDGQLQWMRETLAAYEADESIDHVFVTIHTPAFPNSGHIEDDMWYDGDNRQRPVVLDDAACVAKSFPGFFDQWPGVRDDAPRR